jgi:hypothetical protein
VTEWISSISNYLLLHALKSELIQFILVETLILNEQRWVVMFGGQKVNGTSRGYKYSTPPYFIGDVADPNVLFVVSANESYYLKLIAM